MGIEPSVGDLRVFLQAAADGGGQGLAGQAQDAQVAAGYFQGALRAGPT